MLAIPCLSESDDRERKRFIEEEEQLYKVRSSFADQIDGARHDLNATCDEMRAEVERLQELLKVLIPQCEIGLIDLDHGVRGRHVFFPLDWHWRYTVSDWALRYSNAIRHKVNLGNASHVEEWLNKPYPVSEEDQHRICERIHTERSAVLVS